jgi:hypothetical protein
LSYLFWHPSLRIVIRIDSLICNCSSISLSAVFLYMTIESSQSVLTVVSFIHIKHMNQKTAGQVCSNEPDTAVFLRFDSRLR